MEQKKFYLIELDPYDIMDNEPITEKMPDALTDEEFKEIALQTGMVYTPEELAYSWKELSDINIRYL